jgi:outer membrane beta-barrel protein
MLRQLCLFTFLVTSFFVIQLRAQIATSEEDGEIQELEEIYDRIETEENNKAEQLKKEAQKKAEAKAEKPLKQPTKISELGELAPFTDIAVIQRRFLPRTGRIELSGLGGVSTNNQFFNNFGLALKAAYYFHEKYAVEATYLYITSSQRPITEGLKKNQLIATDSLVEPQNFMGIAFKWSPFYGKVAWFQEKIIPFDIYITPGFGITETGIGEKETTYSLGLGQLFALTKGTAIRWDLNWNFYQATVRSATSGTDTRFTSDLFLMIGYSFYFPEATYR